MKKMVVFEQDEFESKKLEIAKAIIKTLNAPYGVQAISRETGEEYSNEELLGLLIFPIDKILSA